MLWYNGVGNNGGIRGSCFSFEQWESSQVAAPEDAMRVRVVVVVVVVCVGGSAVCCSRGDSTRLSGAGGIRL